MKRVPSIARYPSSIEADIDADGRTDRVVIYSLGDVIDRTNQQRLRAELGTGLVYDVKNDWHIDQLYGATDIDRDGRSEVWYSPNTNKPGAISLFVFDDCRLESVRDEDDSTFMMDTYGVWGSDASVACLAGGEVGQFESWRHIEGGLGQGQDIEERWEYRTVRLDGTQVVETARAEGGDLEERPSRFDWSPGIHCKWQAD